MSLSSGESTPRPNNMAKAEQPAAIMKNITNNSSRANSCPPGLVDSKNCFMLLRNVSNAILFRFSEQKLYKSLKSNLCDPGGILTHDFRNRNPTFYTAELRGQMVLVD